MHSIFVTVNVDPEDAKAFAEASISAAQATLRLEPNCYRFDFHADNETLGRFHFYEVWLDRAALKAHEDMPHFQEWLQTTKDMWVGGLTIVRMTTRFPSEPGWKQQRPSALEW